MHKCMNVQEHTCIHVGIVSGPRGFIQHAPCKQFSLIFSVERRLFRSY